jgi:hypothetical protein
MKQNSESSKIQAEANKYKWDKKIELEKLRHDTRNINNDFGRLEHSFMDCRYVISSMDSSGGF